MKDVMTIWMLAAAIVVLGIALDMSRMRVNRVGLSVTGWALMCACAGVLAAIPYMILRRRVWQQLIDAAWTLMGNDRNAPELCRKRLIALKQSGLVGDAVFRACLRSLDD